MHKDVEHILTGAICIGRLEKFRVIKDARKKEKQENPDRKKDTNGNYDDFLG